MIKLLHFAYIDKILKKFYFNKANIANYFIKKLILLTLYIKGGEKTLFSKKKSIKG